jgi:transposase
LGSGSLAPCKKNALRLNAWLVFLDESGFSQRPPIRATWAPRGQTPIIREPFNWKRLSGIGAVFTTPDTGRLRWFLAVHPGGVRAPQVVRFLKALSRHRRKKVILLWDRLPAHRSRIVQQIILKYHSWLHIEWLPAYAPELNPVEPFWDHLDDTVLANTPADDLVRLRHRIHSGIRRLRHNPSVSRGFLRYTGLF